MYVHPPSVEVLSMAGVLGPFCTSEVEEGDEAHALLGNHVVESLDLAKLEKVMPDGIGRGGIVETADEEGTTGLLICRPRILIVGPWGVRMPWRGTVSIVGICTGPTIRPAARPIWTKGRLAICGIDIVEVYLRRVSGVGRGTLLRSWRWRSIRRIS
jgi:hypothetical protein